MGRIKGNEEESLEALVEQVLLQDEQGKREQSLVEPLSMQNGENNRKHG